ncbi:MAG: alkaline phosphatase family protein [Pseudomonadota bacterium]
MNKRPNILFITSDQWRGDCLSALNHPCIKTPNYDALAADGVLFSNHYSVCAPCAPARASLLTGMYMQNHRVVRNGTPLDHRFTNLAFELRKGGYTPTLFGYTDTSLDPRVNPLESVIEHGYENILPGFEEGLLLPDSDPRPWINHLREHGYTIDQVGDVYRQVENDENRSRSFAPTCVQDEHSQTAFLTQKTIDYLEQSEPGWCVHLSYLRPHPPFVASAPWHAMYSPDEVPEPERAASPDLEGAVHPWVNAALGEHGDWPAPWMRKALRSASYEAELRQLRATYYGLVSKVDHYFGKLVAYLKASGQYDDTIIVLTADHGELLGDHWMFGKRGYFDSAYHIPLIIRAPDPMHPQRNHIDRALTESIDVMPTLLDLLDLDIPRQCDGLSLKNVLRGQPLPSSRGELHWEYDFREVADSGLEQAMGVTMDDSHLNVIRDARFKYVHFPSLPPLLFDLQNDPAQTRNLVDDPEYAIDALRLQRQMLSWRMRNDERTLTHMEVTREGILER